MLNTRALKVLAYAIKFNKSYIINNMIEINNICINDFLIASKMDLNNDDIVKIIENL